MVKEEYENIVKNEVQRAIAADEDALKRLCGNYIDNVKAYTQREKVKNKFTGQYQEPDERLMRSIEEKIDIPDSRKDDFRREIMNYIGALSIDGRTFDYKTNERLYKALELKLFEDQKDSIKLTSLVSKVIDADTQAKIDVVKGRLIRDYGYDDESATDVLNYRGQHLCPRRREMRNAMSTRAAGMSVNARRAANCGVCPLALVPDPERDVPWFSKSNAINRASSRSCAARSAKTCGSTSPTAR